MSLRYEQFATGDSGPIVLLHSLALDASIWREFAGLLPAATTVLAPDLPGHGAAPKGDPSSVESMADGVAAWMTSIGTGPVTLIGMSLGGSVAQALTIRHPDLVGRLGLVDTTAWYGPDAPAAWAARGGQAREKGLDSLAGFQLDRWFTDEFRQRRPEQGEALLDIFRRNRLENYVASCMALGAMDLRDGLGKIAVPTAVVVGELDAATPPSHARALADAISGAQLTVLPACKHLSAVEKPADVIAALAAILGQEK
jgi:3-oxoadipate enol-lactonase